MMEQGPPGRTRAEVSVVGLGTWQLGADRGDVDDEAAGEVLTAALDLGVTLLDTADVHGGGRSEERIRKALADRAARSSVATEAGRRAGPRTAEQYSPENLRGWIDRSRRNLGVDTLDRVQLHCPHRGVPRPAVPATGLLTGTYDETTTFARDDHRNVNRHGEDFDVGETFPGVPSALTESQLSDLERPSDERIRARVHDRW